MQQWCHPEAYGYEARQDVEGEEGRMDELAEATLRFVQLRCVVIMEYVGRSHRLHVVVAMPDLMQGY